MEETPIFHYILAQQNRTHLKEYRRKGRPNFPSEQANWNVRLQRPKALHCIPNCQSVTQCEYLLPTEINLIDMNSILKLKNAASTQQFRIHMCIFNLYTIDDYVSTYTRLLMSMKIENLYDPKIKAG